jgi:hypothetical protein
LAESNTVSDLVMQGEGAALALVPKVNLQVHGLSIF